MSTEIEDPVKLTAAELVSGVLADLQQLVEQQFQLTKQEVELELRQRAEASVVLFSGVGICFLGTIVLCLTVVHLLHWLTLPSGADPAWLPLWACYAIVTAGLIIVGGILGVVGSAQCKSSRKNSSLETTL